MHGGCGRKLVINIRVQILISSDQTVELQLDHVVDRAA